METVNENHGKTVEFWMKYINIIHDYHMLVRSIQTGDFEMFVSILPTITNYLFALSQQNYARWMVKYHENLLKLPQTHPAVYEDFKKGLFGIKRTPKAFS